MGRAYIETWAGPRLGRFGVGCVDSWSWSARWKVLPVTPAGAMPSCVDLVDGEGVGRCFAELLAGAEDGRREVGLVGRVREVLGLEAEAVALAVGAAGCADERAGQEIAGVELDARLGGTDFEAAPGCRLADNRGEDLRAVAGRRAGDDVVVVVAVAERELWVVVADAGADRVRGAEVEGCAIDRGDLAGRDQSLVGRGEMVGVEGQLVAEDRAGAFACEVEIGVVGQVDDGRRVGGGAVVDAERAGGGQTVGDVDCEVARVALLAIRAGPGEADSDGIGLADLSGGPDVLVEAADAAVERIWAVVERDLDSCAVDREPAAGDPVGVAADEGAEVGLAVVLDVVVEGGKAESDVGDSAGAVGNADGLDDAAEGKERDLDSTVGKGVDVNRYAVDCAEWLGVEVEVWHEGILSMRREQVVGGW